MAVRTANAKWNGTIKEGKGTLNFSDYSGPYTYASRFEEGEGTNPEELIGAAHAGCFSQFLSLLLTEEGLHPDSIETTAKVHLGKDDVGGLITTIELDTRVKCEGLSREKLDQLAAESKEKCPISRLVAPTEVKLSASLL
jgi:osmotically inducible protein OsmC